MAKYNDLYEKYQQEIETLKQYKAWADEARAAIDAHDGKDVDWRDDLAVADHQLTGQALYQKWQDLADNYQIAADKLSQDIDAEYHEVPFAKPRQQGIEKFWELTGL